MDNFLCDLCPRRCKRERNAEKGQGFCSLPFYPGICRAEPHFWEEPDISGERGSGAVFFCGCVLRCEFCQNTEISRHYCGKSVDADGLIELFKGLENRGVHNINLVSPTPWYHIIAEALEKYKPGVPVICNTSGYEKTETLKRLEGLIDIYLPDFKYSSGEIALRYSQARDYPETALSAIKEMYRQVGAPVHGEDGMMTRGLMIRHLVLPGNVENSLGVLDLISDNFPPSVYLSLMAQYTPTGCEKHAELKRKITEAEYENVSGYALLLGLENGFFQDISSSENGYVPDWNMI